MTVVRATFEDERVIEAAMRTGERPGDVIRRALRLLAHEVLPEREVPPRREVWLEREVWLAQARADARRLTDEDLSAEGASWHSESLPPTT